MSAEIERDQTTAREPLSLHARDSLCREALEHAQDAASAAVERMTIAPEGAYMVVAPVAPCRWPCSICREKGRQ